MYSIILLIHSTAAISAEANKINPRILRKKENLNLKVELTKNLKVKNKVKDKDPEKRVKSNVSFIWNVLEF